VCYIQQGGSIGAAAMVMPHTAMYAADATGSFNGMMTAAGGAGTGHLPTVRGGSAGTAMMMMNADDDGTTGWTAANAPATADVSNYLAAKAGHMVCTAVLFSVKRF